MASIALEKWRTERVQELDALRRAHKSVGGGGRGRRWVTLQINHAYAMLLSSQFQGFCRDLHTESVDHIVNAVQPLELREVLGTEFALHRKLDQGNPNRGNIGADFNRLGLNFWAAVRRQIKEPAVAAEYERQLDLLADWRNAIAHQDFSRVGDTKRLQLKTVNQWRKSCDGLTMVFDAVVQSHIQSLVGQAPWK